MSCNVVCNVVMDMPDSAVSFFTRNGTRSQAELGEIFVAFMKDRLGYVVPECCQNEVDEVMADFDKLATLTSARRSEPYVLNRADAYAETFA